MDIITLSLEQASNISVPENDQKIGHQLWIFPKVVWNSLNVMNFSVYTKMRCHLKICKLFLIETFFIILSIKLCSIIHIQQYKTKLCRIKQNKQRTNLDVYNFGVQTRLRGVLAHLLHYHRYHHASPLKPNEKIKINNNKQN